MPEKVILRTESERDPLVAAYGRASTKKQVDSTDLQKSKMGAYALANDLPRPTYFIDNAISGKTPWENRPAGKELFGMLRPGDHVIISKLDRAFRSLSDCVQVFDRFERLGVKVHVVNLMGGALDLSSSMGRFIVHVLAAFAELERAFISERTKDGMQGKKSNHKRYCHYAGYGFKWDRRWEKGKWVQFRVADPVERNVMKSIHKWRTQQDPLSWEEIVDHLAGLGLKTKEGLPWDLNRVRRCARAEAALILKEQHGVALAPISVKELQKVK